MSKKYLFIFFLISISKLLLADYSGVLKINNNKLNIEIADTDQKRTLGLMFRKSMPDSCGMLFVFDEEQELSFWMRNTIIPLSIAYINSDGLIITIKDMKPYSLDGIISDGVSLYALEVNKGWFDKHNIKLGDQVEF